MLAASPTRVYQLKSLTDPQRVSNAPIREKSDRRISNSVIE